jgi:hypothetical protein
LSNFAAPVIVPEIITARMTSICLNVIMTTGSPVGGSLGCGQGSSLTA